MATEPDDPAPDAAVDNAATSSIPVEPQVLQYQGFSKETRAEAMPWHLHVAAGLVYAGSVFVFMGGLYVTCGVIVAGKVLGRGGTIAGVLTSTGLGMFILEYHAIHKRSHSCAIAIAIMLGVICLFLLVCAVWLADMATAPAIVGAMTLVALLCCWSHGEWALRLGLLPKRGQ